MTEDGSTMLVDERVLRQEQLAGRELNTGLRSSLPGVATNEERQYYYHMGKKGMGFTPEDRRHIWL